MAYSNIANTEAPHYDSRMWDCAIIIIISSVIAKDASCPEAFSQDSQELGSADIFGLSCPRNLFQSNHMLTVDKFFCSI